MATLAQRVVDLSTRIGNYIRDSILPRLLPTGGTSGQVLAKTSANNFEVGWSSPGGGADPWTRVGLVSDHVNATTGFTDIPGFTCTIPANTNFTIELEAMISAIATANLPRLGFNWSAALTRGVAEIEQHSSASAKVFTNGLNLTAAGNVQTAVGTAPVAGHYLVRGFFKGRTAGAAVTIKAQLAAESAAANAAIARPGSEFRYRTGP